MHSKTPPTDAALGTVVAMLDRVGDRRIEHLIGKKDFTTKESKMNEHTLSGKWMQLKGKIRQQWGKLTDDDMDKIQGNYEMLVGRLQELYGRSREETEREVNSQFQQWDKDKKAA